jgi:hypothetical protein
MEIETPCEEGDVPVTPHMEPPNGPADALQTEVTETEDGWFYSMTGQWAHVWCE